jgi:formiminoglutamase
MNVKSNFFQLNLPLNAWISAREGEERIGQTIGWRDTTDSWMDYHFHIIGIRESIGPQLNGGLPGAENGFDAFITRFLALQSNAFFSGNNCCLHGTIDFTGDSSNVHSEMITDLDDLVAEWALEIGKQGGIPIVIGGGHNNAFPLIKAASMCANEGIVAVNLDPHADLRDMAGRHSGNPFSYALEADFLKKYYCLGLHESYNNSAILKRIEQFDVTAFYFEDWIDHHMQFYTDTLFVFDQISEQSVGIELDMDAISGMPSSAFTPSGVSMEQARFYVRKMAQLAGVRYVHFPEAAPKSEQEVKIVGKALSYLVADFIKVHSNFLK